MLIRHAKLPPKQTVAGDQTISVFARNRLLPKLAAGAFDNQSASGDVPKPDAALNVGIETATRHISQRQCRRAHDSNFPDAAYELVKIRQSGFEAFVGLGEADGHDGLVQPSPPADADDFPVQT